MTTASKRRYRKIESKLKSTCMDKMNLIFENVEDIADKCASPHEEGILWFPPLLYCIIWWNDNEMEPEKYEKELVSGILGSVITSNNE